MKNIYKFRLEKVTYGLIYPAFFGNMIYDIINLGLDAIKHNTGLTSIFILCSLIILFVVVDYIHLNADVNNIYCRAEFKSSSYFLCDILTPTILFISFVLLKDSNYFSYGVFAFSLVPPIILIWKWKNPKSKIYFSIYSILSVLVGLLLTFNIKNWGSSCNIQLFVFLSLLVYFLYSFIFYPNFSRQFDLDEVERLKIKLNINCNSN